MEDFYLPVEHNGQEHNFKASLVAFGHTHKFHVDINGQTVIFEHDEERNYRAVIPYEELTGSKKVDAELLRSISVFLEEIFK
jgi:hypothetical protein